MENKSISEEVKEVFNEPDFEKILKTLATEFGSDASLQTVHDTFQKCRPVPSHTINGQEYLAGYFSIHPGNYIGTLLDIRQHGNMCKLMFEILDTKMFLYLNYPISKLKVEHVVRLSQYLNRKFPVTVDQETIANTGDKHAVITFVDGLEEVLEHG